MKVTGDATLHAPVDRVWAALNDPAVLVRTIPGCQRLEETGPDEYRMTITAGVASIKGAYQGTVKLTDQDEPHAFVLAASGAGAPGTVDALVHVRLREDGDAATRLDYDADATVGGTVAGVGQRVLAGVAKKTAREFFAAVDGVLQGVPVPAAEGVPGRPETVTVGPVASRVFEAPPAPARGADAWALTTAAGAGGVIALAGVLLGWLIGRRSRR
jgi:carbon monoxide dehydrogenase subunit G